MNSQGERSRYRFEVLDSFRGIAAIMVAMFHLSVNGYLSNTNILKNSWLFVDFFFVLSGFVISYVYLNKIVSLKTFLSFMRKRFFRLYPLHLFMLILFIPFAVASFFMGVDLSERFSFIYFLESLTLTQALGIANGETWNIPAWSISTEFYTYILFGILLIFFSKQRVSIFITIIIISFIIVFNFSSMSDTYKFSFFRCTYSFFLGVIAFIVYRNINIKWWFEVVVFIFSLILLSYSEISSRSLQAFSYPFLFFIIIVVFSKETGPISFFLKKRTFQTLGKLSFSIYLTHAWFITCIKSFSIITEKLFGFKYMYEVDGMRTIDFGLGFYNDLIFIPYLLVVILFSAFTYKYIEMYFQNKFFRKST